MLVRLCRFLAAAVVLAIIAGAPAGALAHSGHKTPIEVVQAAMEIAKIQAAGEKRATKAATDTITAPVFVTSADNPFCDNDCNCSSCNGHCHGAPAMVTAGFFIESLPNLVPKSMASDPAHYLEPDATEQPPKFFA